MHLQPQPFREVWSRLAFVEDSQFLAALQYLSEALKPIAFGQLAARYLPLPGRLEAWMKRTRPILVYNERKLVFFCH